jgi:hypothetical protein
MEYEVFLYPFALNKISRGSNEVPLLLKLKEHF